MPQSLTPSLAFLAASAADLIVQLPVLSSVWVFLLGACIGSFMNVVIYRLPAGLSLVHPPSHCPKCQQPIRTRDNFPILGWILLRGRCRDCHVRIPARYALVEAAVAIVFLTFWVADVVWLPMIPTATLVRLGEFGLHVMLSCTVICAALIDLDGNEVPRRLFAPAMISLLAAMIFAPYLVYYLHDQGPPMHPLLGIPIGAVVGGAFAWIGSRGIELPRTRRANVALGILVGTYCSWFSVSSMVLVISSFLTLGRNVRHPHFGRWSLLLAWVLPVYLFVEALAASWRVMPFPLAVQLTVPVLALLLVLGSRWPRSRSAPRSSGETR